MGYQLEHFSSRYRAGTVVRVQKGALVTASYPRQTAWFLETEEQITIRDTIEGTRIMVGWREYGPFGRLRFERIEEEDPVLRRKSLVGAIESDPLFQWGDGSYVCDLYQEIQPAILCWTSVKEQTWRLQTEEKNVLPVPQTWDPFRIRRRGS